MSDDKVTEKMSDPAGLNCPAARPLCLCGVRGCRNAAEHNRTMTTSTRRSRR